MANNDDVKAANQEAPMADIPDLKKKEEERKKAGVAWSGAKPGAVVARAAASAAGAPGTAAAGAAGAAGGASSFLAGLTATALGKAVVAAGVAAFLGGAGLFGYTLIKGGGTGAAGGGDLGAISSSMKVRAGGDDRTGYVASKGEIRFDPLEAAQAKKEEPAPQDAAAGQAPAPAEETADAGGPGAAEGWKRPELAHNLSGAKLSASLGGGFGGKNIFAGGSGPKLNESLSKVNFSGGQKGRLSSASRNAQTGRRVAGKGGRQMKANKAFGQLRVAKGAGTGAVGRAAFGEAIPGAGDIKPEPGPPTEKPEPEDLTADLLTTANAPDVTAPSVSDPGGVDVDQYKTGKLAGIAAMAKKAGKMKKKAELMMYIGSGLIIAGIVMMCTLPFWGQVVGGILIAIGLILVTMSIMMSQEAEKMKDQAESMNRSLEQRTGDKAQGDRAKACIDRMYDSKDCEEDREEAKRAEERRQRNLEEHKKVVDETGKVSQ